MIRCTRIAGYFPSRHDAPPFRLGVNSLRIRVGADAVVFWWERWV